MTLPLEHCEPWSPATWWLVTKWSVCVMVTRHYDLSRT